VDSFVHFSRQGQNSVRTFSRLGWKHETRKFVIRKGEENLLAINSSHINIANNLQIGKELRFGSETSYRINGFRVVEDGT